MKIDSTYVRLIASENASLISIWELFSIKFFSAWLEDAYVAIGRTDFFRGSRDFSFLFSIILNPAEASIDKKEVIASLQQKVVDQPTRLKYWKALIHFLGHVIGTVKRISPGIADIAQCCIGVVLL